MSNSFREAVLGRILAEVSHPFAGVPEPADREVLGRVYDRLVILDPPVEARQVVEALEEQGLTHGSFGVVGALQKAINSR